jgi:hypothetical protein
MKKRIKFIKATVLAAFLLLSGCISNQHNEYMYPNYESSNKNGNTSRDFMTFNYPPFDLKKVAFILPMGGMTGSHVTPIDHQYYVSYDFNKGDKANVDIDVYSPGDGIVTEIQHMSIAVGDTPMAVDDFRLVIQHTLTISSIYIHIDELSDKLAKVDPGLGEYANVNVEVSAGEVIGRYSGSVDYNIVDEDVVLPFVNPVSYENEDWKIHCPDPFDYFNESIKNQLVEKCLRIQDPIGGKICYDIDGKLIGSWFEEGTNGYAGVDTNRYWAGHLSIVYDSIDPDAIIVSIGTFINTSEQFVVKENGPDPANISLDDGLVIYELVDFEYYKNSTIWNRTNLVKELKVRNSEYVQGVILLQLIEDRKLKVEIFPRKNADQIDGFTENAVIYER